MSAVILDFTESARRSLRPLAPESVHDEVLRRLRGRVIGMRIAEAQARADALMTRQFNPVPRNLAVARVVSWALCATSNDPEAA